MPKETRLIVFSLDELLEALTIHSQKEDLAPPSATKLTHLRMSDDKRDVLVKTESDRELSFDLPTFVLVLVYFCQAHHIPIPKKGTKLLIVQPENLTMKIEL